MPIRKDESQPLQDGEHRYFMTSDYTDQALITLYTDMGSTIRRYIFAHSSAPLNMIYDGVWELEAVKKYLEYTSNSIVYRQAVRNAIQLGFRAYIDKKDFDEQREGAKK